MTENVQRQFSLPVSLVLFIAAACVAAIISNQAPLATRAIFSLVATTFAAMITASFLARRTQSPIWSVVLGTIVSQAAFLLWRHTMDMSFLLGSFPPTLDLVAFAVFAGFNIIAAVIVAKAFSSLGEFFRFRRLVFLTVAIALLSMCFGILQLQRRPDHPTVVLRQVVALEQSADDRGQRQSLSAALAMLGRQCDANAVALTDRWEGLEEDQHRELEINVVPWRDAIGEIAESQQLVLVMENHASTEHREWIEQTLTIFRGGGFTDYAAEALGESGGALKRRGYPVVASGFYTMDPRFGNLLRRAIDLDFKLHSYDMGATFEVREEFAATELASLFLSDPSTKFLVHAGGGHILKYPQPNIGRWMAARLWEKTGVEPFTIWQWDRNDSNDYEKMLRLIGPIDEAVVLMPQPLGLIDSSFRDYPDGPAVDAIVVHPRETGGTPNNRKPVFWSGLKQVRGVWDGNRWPVVIGAFKANESADAIALDQVMLREGETGFELWIRDVAHEIRIFDLSGEKNASVKIDTDRVHVSVDG